MGDYYVVGSEYSVKLGCCTTNLCNYYDYINRTLNYECISDKYKNEKPKKLLFPLVSLKSPSVSKCYSCENCTNPEKEATIVECGKTTKKDKYSCYVSNIRLLFINLFLKAILYIILSIFISTLTKLNIGSAGVT